MSAPAGPAATERFSWAAISTSADPRYWQLGWELHALQRAVIARAMAAPARRTVGGLYVPLADLEATSVSNSLDYLGADPTIYPDCRDVTRPADAQSSVAVPAGATLELLVELPDRYNEAMGASVWRSVAGGAFFATALEGRWGCEAVLTDDLIVPADSPAAGDPRARRAILDEIREVTIDYRKRKGLRPEGTAVDPREALIIAQLDELSDAERFALMQSWSRNPILDREQRTKALPPEVQAVCFRAWSSVSRHRGDGTAPTPPLKPRSTPGGEPYRDPFPYAGGGGAAACAAAAVLARDALEASRSRSERLQGSLAERWTRAWLGVFPRLPGE